MISLALLLSVLAVPPAMATAYLLLLTLCSARHGSRGTTKPRTRFDVIVPAHDEEAGIGATVSSLCSVDYPAELFRVVVVADNCTDRTADVAARAGAQVICRTDRDHKGKGHALDYAFRHIVLPDRDAVVVVDADTLVSPNLLKAFDSRLQAGADAVQCDYAVRNAAASWRTLVMSIAFGSFHRLRSLARERLGVSCGLKGNGMCFSLPLLRRAPHDAFSIVEDVEYGMRLADAGYRVTYAPEARVYGEMVTGERASRSQRRRWEAGRAELRRRAWSILLKALRARDGVALDLAVDILVPPLATLVVAVTVGTIVSLGVLLLGYADAARASLLMWGFCWAGLFAYLLRGWQLSETGARGLFSLVHVPAYIVWKLVLRLRLRRDREPRAWVRTARLHEVRHSRG